MASNPYEVGFAKPPKWTRFHKGASGNPKGRPKGKCNLATVLEKTLQEKILIVEDGKTRVVTKRQAFVEQLVNKGISGDSCAARLLFTLDRSSDQTLEPAKNISSDADVLVMKHLVKRLKKIQIEVENDEARPESSAQPVSK